MKRLLLSLILLAVLVLPSIDVSAGTDLLVATIGVKVVVDNNIDVTYTGKHFIDKGIVKYEYIAHIYANPIYNDDGSLVDYSWQTSEITEPVGKINGGETIPDNKGIIEPSYTITNDIFTTTVIGSAISVIYQDETMNWNPVVLVDSAEYTAKEPVLLAVDPINENYRENTLEWDYGVCVRRVRVIESSIQETWIFNTSPKGTVWIKDNAQKTAGFTYAIAPYAYDANGNSLVINQYKQVMVSEFEKAVYPVTIDPTVTFNTTPSGGNWTVPVGVSSVEVLVVAGGGAGGSATGGGGGAGGLVYNASYPVVEGTNISVTVGAGGAYVSSASGNNGNNSVFGTLTATGGGGGGTEAVGKNGGCGGGGGLGSGTTRAGGVGSQGFNGGIGQAYALSTHVGTGGGGGMGGIGTNGSLNSHAAGGIGLVYNISGSNVTYSTGGNGSHFHDDKNGVAGSANTGNGGGGSGEDDSNVYGGNGGSGIIIIKYAASAAPTVATYSPASSVTNTSAVCNGSVTDNGTNTITAYGICYGLFANPDTTGTKNSTSADILGNFSKTLSPLTAGQTYYYRAFATNVVGTSYGAEYTFLTSPNASIVTTNPATYITTTQARLNGYLDNGGGETCQVKFQYANWNGSAWVGNTSTANQSKVAGESFIEDLVGLTINTQYTFRAESINSYGQANGSWLVFNTSASSASIGVPTTLCYAGSNTVDLSWVKGANSSATYIRWKTGAYPTDYSDGYLLPLQYGVDYTHTGLSSGTSYYYKLWGYDSGNISTTNSTTMCTTTAGSSVATTVPLPTQDTSGWNASPDGSVLSNNPLYPLGNLEAAAIGVPQATWWMLVGLGGLVVIGLFIYTRSNRNLLAALGAMIIFGVIMAQMGIFPIWVMYVFGLAGIGMSWKELR